MTLVLLNSRNREIFKATLDASGKAGTYDTDNGGGSGPREALYLAAAVCASDVPSAKPAGPLAGLWRAWVEANKTVWPCDRLVTRKTFGGGK